MQHLGRGTPELYQPCPGRPATLLEHVMLTCLTMLLTQGTGRPW